MLRGAIYVWPMACSRTGLAVRVFRFFFACRDATPVFGCFFGRDYC